MSRSRFDPGLDYPGGFTTNDGTIDFYGRVRSLIDPESVVLDLGAGRGEWFEDDRCQYRKSVRLLKGFAKEVVGADVDEAVLGNRSTDKNVMITGDRIDIEDRSVDLIVADYVLEHLEFPRKFADEVRRVLKPGGYFCARTPHKMNYVSIGARFTANFRHSAILDQLQPDRDSVDVFPTVYKLNTLKSVAAVFQDFDNYSFLFRTDPAYFFGNRHLYKLMRISHRVMPRFLCSNIFVFLRIPKVGDGR